MRKRYRPNLQTWRTILSSLARKPLAIGKLFGQDAALRSLLPHKIIVTFILVAVGLFLILASSTASAQSGVSRIFISSGDAGGAPTIELHLYGMDGEGNAADLSGQSFTVQHNGSPVSDVTVAPEVYQGGTFTIFLLDITSGVANFVPTIQEGIRQFASEPNMVEQLDYATLYRVGAVAAEPILAADTFHNSIINAVASPPEPSSSTTALRDSIVGLLDNLSAIKPRPDMVVHMVVFSDGTDRVSTASQPEDVPKRAAELGVPIHTVWLRDESLQSIQEGQQYMSQVAVGSLGLSITLNTTEDLAPLWSRIAGFRNQTVVRYTTDTITGGDFQVSVGLASNPNIQDQTSITVPPGAPSVNLAAPSERNITIPAAGQSVRLQFSADVTWLDGVDREVSTAQLLVNGVVVQQLDTANLESFESDISNFVFGDNRVQVAVVDNEGGRATSPAVILNVSQGDLSVPDEVAPSSALERLWDRFSGIAVWVGGCLGGILVLLFLLFVAYLGRRSPILAQLGVLRILGNLPFIGPFYQQAYQLESAGQRASSAKNQLGRYAPDVKGTGRGKQQASRVNAFLELVEATTRFSGRIELDQMEMRLGRSAKQADIVFGEDRTVSRIHATITREGNDFRIFDEQSASGTWVNEQRVPEYGLQLVDSDEIRIGAVRLRFRQL